MPSKQELDKEMMFRKIMPSATQAGGPASPADASEASAPAPPADDTGNPPTGREASTGTPQPQTPQPGEAPAGGGVPANTAPGDEAPDELRVFKAPPEMEATVIPIPQPVEQKAARPAPPPPADSMPEAPRGSLPAQPAPAGGVPAAPVAPEPSSASASTAASAPAPPPAQAATGGGAQQPPHPVNLAELLVDRVYTRYRQRLNGCGCARCRDDACGIALNKVKPRYVASDRMEPGAENDRELVTETVTALMKALFLVKRRPRHTAEDLAAMQQM